MILDFTVENFGPFKGPVTMSMHATGMKGLESNIIETSQVKSGILSSAVVFGANAAGKTFLIKSLAALKKMVASAYRDGYQYRWYEPFRLSRDSLGSPVSLRIRLLISDVLYDYRVSYLASSVVEESLYHYPKGKRSRVFTREGNTYTGSKKRVESMTSPSSTYLAVASDYNDSVCALVRRAILEDILIFDDLETLIHQSCVFGSENPEVKRRMVDGLRTADLGIADYSFHEEEEDVSDMQRILPPDFFENLSKNSDKVLVLKDMSMRHDFEGTDVDPSMLSFPLEIESAGTRSMFGLMGPLVDSLMNGKTIVIDELGAHLHPLITRWIVAQFSGDSNPSGAQLIANTHDLSLLDMDLLRRDQIWFVNRDVRAGASELYSLSDFNGVRKNSDIRKAYLFGRFDAVPNIRSRSVMS